MGPTPADVQKRSDDTSPPAGIPTEYEALNDPPLATPLLLPTELEARENGCWHSESERRASTRNTRAIYEEYFLDI